MDNKARSRDLFQPIAAVPGSYVGYRGYAIPSNPPYIGASWGGRMPKAGTGTPYTEEFGVAMTCIA